MDNQLILAYQQIYKIYRYYCHAIKQIKCLDTSKKCIRKPNFPELISELCVYLILKQDCTRSVLSGDLCWNGKRIEVKCFASSGPMSFGPNEYWDMLYIVDARHNPTIKVYCYNYAQKSSEWQNIYVNKKETFGYQCSQKRRPRITSKALFSQLKPEFVGEYNINSLFKNAINDNQKIQKI